MLRFVDVSSSACSISRREWLRVGGLAALGAGLRSGAALADPTLARAGFGRARSVILVFASGGQSQLDMWDPKPNAPDHVRGAFSAIPTALPGVHFTEQMPKIARVADRFTVVRSMSHEDLDHGTAAYLALTGRYHSIRSGNPPIGPNDFPTYGAVLRRIRPRGTALHEAIHLNGPALVPEQPSPGQNGGFLGREYEPMVVGDVSRQPVAIAGLDPLRELPPVRLAARQRLKEALDQYVDRLESNQLALDLSQQYRQAYEMLSQPRYRDAFDLGQESEATRDRYGRHRSGQACLLARRLAEAGVPLITVIWNHSNRGQDKSPDDTNVYGWDTHNDIFEALRVHLLPRFDESFSALIEDLDARGLLEQTLVVCLGEFGRAPLVAREVKFAGSTPGRKHWASVYSIVVAGAGVGRGRVLGASDRLGAEPRGTRFGPWDVAATMYWSLGIDPAAHFHDAVQRSFPITIGNPIRELYDG